MPLNTWPSVKKWKVHLTKAILLRLSSSYQCSNVRWSPSHVLFKTKHEAQRVTKMFSVEQTMFPGDTSTKFVSGKRQCQKCFENMCPQHHVKTEYTEEWENSKGCSVRTRRKYKNIMS